MYYKDLEDHSYTKTNLYQIIQSLCNRKLEKENPIFINKQCYKLYEMLSKKYKLILRKNKNNGITNCNLPYLNIKGDFNIGPYDPELESYHYHLKYME